jgi:hypothetical protein
MFIPSWLATYPVLHDIHPSGPYTLLGLNFRVSGFNFFWYLILHFVSLSEWASCIFSWMRLAASWTALVLALLLSMIPFRRHSLDLFFCTWALVGSAGTGGLMV